MAAWLRAAHVRRSSRRFQKHVGKLCAGVQIHVDDEFYSHAAFRPWRLQALAFKALRKLEPKYPLWREFAYEYEHDRLAIDLLSGSDLLRLWVDDRRSSRRTSISSRSPTSALGALSAGNSCSTKRERRAGPARRGSSIPSLDVVDRDDAVGQVDASRNDRVLDRAGQLQTHAVAVTVRLERDVHQRRVKREARARRADRQRDALGQRDRERLAIPRDNEGGAVRGLVHARNVVERRRARRVDARDSAIGRQRHALESSPFAEGSTRNAVTSAERTKALTRRNI
jgi:hypothetical protein